MRVCDVCISSQDVRSFPWGRQRSPVEPGNEPSGTFDLCKRCQEVLSENGLPSLLARSEEQPY